MLEEKYEPDVPASGFDSMYSGSGQAKAAEQTLPSADDRYHFDQSELDRVQRRLKQRHVQMCVPLHTRS
jgi:amino acid permease